MKVRPKPAARAEWRRHVLPLLGLWAFALLAYSNSFGAGFVFDSDRAILRDSRVQAATSENLHLILNQEYWYKSTATLLYRPLTTFSYLFNYVILGNGTDPAGYHWINFALHAVNIALVYLLGLMLYRETEAKERMALAMAAVWALHPVLSESVTNIVGRADLLAGFGVLAGLVCHAKGEMASGWRRVGWLSAVMLAATIGMFSKESTIVLLAAMGIYDLTFGKGGARARVPGYVAAALPVALYLLVRDRVISSLVSAPIPFTDNPLVGAGFWTARLTAVKVIGNYLWLLLWPRSLSCDYSYNQVSLFAWGLGGIAALAVCAAAAAAAIFCYRRQKAVCFFIAFFFAALAPTSNLILLIGSIMAERFLYLPSVGFAGCLVWAIYRRPRLAPAILAVICAALAVRTYARNVDWQDDRSLWTSAARVSPDSYKTHLHVATAVIGREGEGMDRAINEVNRTLAILDGLPDSRNVPQAYATAGLIYVMQGELLAAKGSRAESQAWYQKAVDVLLRGERADRIGAEEAIRDNQLRGVRVAVSGWYPLYLTLGDAYLRLADPRKAVEAFEYGRVLRPAPEFFEDMSDAWRAMGDRQRAAIVLIEGLLVDKSYTKLASELVELYKQGDAGSCALANSNGTLSVNAACPEVHDQICTAFGNVKQLYLKMGQEPLAAGIAQRAVGEGGCPASL